MDWLPVRARMLTWLKAGLADGVACFTGGVVVRVPDRPAATLGFRPDGDGANSVLLAGTSLRNEAKIWLSSGCVHMTFAVSPGTTSPRGKFGMVKKAILLDGMLRSDSPRSYRPVIPPSWLSIVRDFVVASRNW